MIHKTFFSSSTGAVVGKYNGLNKNHPIPHNTIVKDGVYDTTYRLNLVTKEVEQKTVIPYNLNKTIIKADSVDVATFTTLPYNTKIYVDNQVCTVDDGIFEFSVDTPGVYTLTLTSPVSLDTIVTVTAVL